MNIKKTYAVGDTVWIYGVSRNNQKLTKGTIVHEFTPDGYTEVQYVVSIPTAIEQLLEVRDWNTISQDAKGPVGAMREMIAVSEMDAVNKKMMQAGYEFDPSYQPPEVDEPTPDEIHAALERDQKAVEHAPLMIKENRPRTGNRRNFSRRKKQ
jgi:hypothetical protein